MVDEIKIKTKNTKTKVIVAAAAILIAIVTIVAIVVVVSNNATAKKVKEQLSLGDRYLSELQYEQAIVAYELAIEIDPKSADAYLGLATVYVAVDDYEKAEDILEKAQDVVDNEDDLRRIENMLKEIRGKSGNQKDKESNKQEMSTVVPSPTTAVVKTEPTQLPIQEDLPMSDDMFRYREEVDGTITILEMLAKAQRNVKIPNEIDGKEVKTIGEYAFSYSAGWESIEIPASVTDIKVKAIFSCNSLATLVVEEGNPRYTSCDSQGNECNAVIEKETNELVVGCIGTVIPENVISIGNSAFGWQGGLKSLYIPGNVKSIGEDAFLYCRDLVSVELSEGLTTIDNSAFFGCQSLTSVEIPGSVTKIGTNAFAICDNLTTMYVREGNLRYSSRDLSGNECNGIMDWQASELISGCSTTVIPEGITQIGYGAFWHCYNLNSLALPESLKVIGDSAFLGCKGLRTIRIPANVERIVATPFNKCDVLQDIVVDENNKFYSSLEGALLNKEKTVLIKAPYGKERYVVPDSVEEIFSNGFWWNETIQSITISENVTKIGYGAFCNCYNLTEIVIPSSVSEIEADVFYGCENVTIITSPGSFAEKFAKENGIAVMYQ